jgi:RHS repeat-associated protein
MFESETFNQVIEYDALNRMTRLYNWHHTAERMAVYEPRYNERGVLASEDLVIRAARETVAGKNRYTGGTRTSAIRAIKYNAKGQRTSTEYGNDAITRYEYDSETFRLTDLVTTRPAAPTKLQDLKYTYDPVGNITTIRDDAQQTVYFDNAEVLPHCRYEYDALYRLIKAEGREHATQNNVQRDYLKFEPIIGIPFPNSPEALQTYTEHYEYDSVGNIQKMQHVGGESDRWTRRYQYAENSNRLLATSLPGDARGLFSARCDYDLHGSMLNLNRTPDDYRLRWDYRDMIHHVNLGGGGDAWYNYGADKQRTRKRIERNSGVIEDRFYLGGMEVYRRHVGAAGNPEEEIETHHLLADDQRILIVEDVLVTDNTVLGDTTLYRYQLGNHLGSACVELDESAAVITYEEYHPYGTTAYQAGRSDVEVNLKRYRYTGMERDEETGFSYHTARYYVTWLGRWVKCDPVRIAAGPNIYSYVSANPVRFRDLTGHQGTSAEVDLSQRIETLGWQGLPETEEEVRERGRIAGYADDSPEMAWLIQAWRIESGERPNAQTHISNPANARQYEAAVEQVPGTVGRFTAEGVFWGVLGGPISRGAAWAGGKILGAVAKIPGVEPVLERGAASVARFFRAPPGTGTRRLIMEEARLGAQATGGVAAEATAAGVRAGGRVVVDLGGGAEVTEAAQRMSQHTGHALTRLTPGSLSGATEVTLIGHGVVVRGQSGAVAVRVGPQNLSATHLAERLYQAGWRGGVLRLGACQAALCPPSGSAYFTQLERELARLGAPSSVAGARGDVFVPRVPQVGPVTPAGEGTTIDVGGQARRVYEQLGRGWDYAVEDL